MAANSLCALEEDELFTRDMPTVPPELLEDILCVLAKQNDDAVRNPDDFLLHDHLGGQHQTVVGMLRQLRPSAPISSVGVRRFLVKHVRDLRRQLDLPRSSVSWDDVMARLKEQVLLRALSCVQIASKKFSNASVVTVSAVRGFLKRAGQSYSGGSVLQSEIRVLNTLQFRVEFPTPLVYVEVLLDVIGYNDPSFEVEKVYPAALRVLQGFYLMRLQVYDKVLRHLRLDSASSDDQKTRMVRAFKADQLLLASAIVISAVHLTLPCRYKQLLAHVHAVTRLEKREVQDLSSVLMAVLASEGSQAD
ncbi:unnamed protein product [Ixodes hexagonus]